MDSNVSSTRGWVVTLAGTGINLALGALYSWSVIAKVLSEPGGAWGWSSAKASLPYAVAVGVFALMMVFAGRAQDRFGPRIVATLGGALMGLGLIVASFASKGNLALMVVGFGVLTGTGIGLGYASATPAAIKWFAPAKRGLISGIVVSGFGLASVYVAPTTQALLANYGVNQTFLILGVAFLLATVLLAQLLKNPPDDYVPEGTPTASEESIRVSEANEYDWQDMVKTPQFFILWLMYAFSSFAGLMIIGHMAKIAAMQLKGIELGFLLVACLAIGNAAGRIIAGSVSDKLGRARTMMIVFLSQAAMMGFLAFAANTFFLIIVAAAIGFNYGANLALFPATTTDYFGKRNLGVNYGLVFTAWGVGGVFGSMAAGKIVDVTGSYNMSFVVAGILCVLAAAMTFALKAPRSRA